MKANLSDQYKTYRQLQRHLDKQAVGFPATRSGADIRLLERLFTPDEAKLALHLSDKAASTQTIIEKTQALFPAADIEQMLERMFMKGAIARKEQNVAPHWYLVPLVIGMYESQDGAPSLKFLRDAAAYMNTLAYGKSLLAVKPPQMRTIPINKSISIDHHVAAYDQIRSIINTAAEPFVVLNCICRVGAKLRRKPCKKTTRSETCLAFGNSAQMVLRRNHGRKISRDEALAIALQNEEEGLVFQPSAVKEPEFVCSCCGCCCGMLGMQKKIPRPVDFWTSSFYVELNEEDCIACRKCSARCQVEAITFSDVKRKPQINLARCIGCGLCVSTCEPKALRLVKKKDEIFLPKDEEALVDEIRKNKKSPIGQWLMMLKVVLGMRQ